MIRHVYIGRDTLKLPGDTAWCPEHGVHPGDAEDDVAGWEALPSEHDIYTCSPIWLNYIPPEKIRLILADGSVVPVALDNPNVAAALDLGAPGEIWCNFGEEFLAGMPPCE